MARTTEIKSKPAQDNPHISTPEVSPITKTSPVILPQNVAHSEVPAQKETSWEKFVRWLESPLVVSGGLAVILGSFGLLYNAPIFSFIVLLIGWGLFVLSIFKHNFYEDKTHKEQKVRKTIISIIIGIVLFVCWIMLQPQYVKQERPIITIVDALLKSPLKSGEFPVGQFKLKNSGQIPATKIRTVTTINLLTKDEVKRAQQGILPQMSSENVKTGNLSVLTAGDSLTLLTEQRKDADSREKQARMNGDYVFYVWLEIHYSDMNGNEYVYKGCSYSENVDSRDFVICNHWNEFP